MNTSNVTCAVYFCRKIWRNYETASPGVTKRERRQGKSLVQSFDLSFKYLFETRVSPRDTLMMNVSYCVTVNHLWALKHILVFSKMLILDVVRLLSEYEISAPMQRNSYWGSTMTIECAVYEPSPRVVAPPPPAAQVIQRGSWKTGSTSSTSSESWWVFFHLHDFFFSHTVVRAVTEQKDQSTSFVRRYCSADELMSAPKLLAVSLPVYTWLMSKWLANCSI